MSRTERRTLLSPRFEYDVALSSYFLSADVVGAPENTSLNQAGALKRFLDFLWVSRPGRSWRDTTEADHLAVHQWRRRDEAGPRVAGTTWEPGGLTRQPVLRVGGEGRARPGESDPAAAPAGGAARWGSVAGFVVRDRAGDLRLRRERQAHRVAAAGVLPQMAGRGAPRLRQRCDLPGPDGPHRDAVDRAVEPDGAGDPDPARPERLSAVWLPGPIAKYFSARWIYMPENVVRDVASYVEFDRPR
jgi:hypothetical protein